VPDSFAQTPNGLLLIANGFGPMFRWNSFTNQAEPAGVLPPATALTVSGTLPGPIVGTYTAYTRFVDGNGNFSNLSPISNSYTAIGTTGNVFAASNATPIVINSAGHGLLTGTVVKIVGVGGNTSANGTWTITVIDLNNFSLNGSSGTATYTGGGTWTSGVNQITYTNVPLPAEIKVLRRQILRNTDGQAQTYYVDIDTTDLTSPSLSSTLTDTQLAAQPFQAILDVNGAILANQYTVPPNHKAVVAYHLDRMFAAAEVDYNQGGVQTVYGSTTVTGIGTEWPGSAFTNRFLWVVGASQPYQIASCEPVGQTLTLTTPYLDATDNFANYAIRPAPAERRLIYYTQSGLPEAWPATNAITVAEDGDEITGLMAKGSFIYILERHHVYRFTFQNNPAAGGAMFLSSLRGCINNRCWVLVDDTAYMLDDQGIHAFSGGEVSEPISQPIQDIFRPSSPSAYRINWSASNWFHAVHFAPQETVRFFVVMSGQEYPRHALCYNYRLKRWWIEEFNAPICSSSSGRINGIPQVFLGSSAKRVFAYWQGTIDGPDPAMGTVRGTVASSTLTTITDSLATYASSGLVGSPVSITYGTGKYQTRIITAVSGQTITVNLPWTTIPDSTSVYQIGGIHWRVQFGWLRFLQDEETNERRIEVVFSPLPNLATMDLRVRMDFSNGAYTWGQDQTSADGNGVQTISGTSDLIVDLTKQTGIIQKRFPSHKEFFLDGKRYSQIELEGFSNADQISVFQVVYDGVTKPQGGP